MGSFSNYIMTHLTMAKVFFINALSSLVGIANFKGYLETGTVAVNFAIALVSLFFIIKRNCKKIENEKK